MGANNLVLVADSNLLFEARSPPTFRKGGGGGGGGGLWLLSHSDLQKNLQKHFCPNLTRGQNYGYFLIVIFKKFTEAILS